MSKPTRLFKGVAAAIALAASTSGMAANSTISSAVQSGSTLVVKGANFGTKSKPAPTFFQSFSDLSNGATPAAAGFDSWVNRGGEAVTLADGIGGGSLRADPGKANNAMPHIGKYLPANTSEVRVSFYFKLYGSSANSSTQMKFARAGVHVPGDDGSEDYASSNAKFYPSIYFDGNGVMGANSIAASYRSNTTPYNFYPDESGGGSTGVPLRSQQSDTDFKQWVYAEVYYKLNDVGSSNGAYKIALNGFVWHNRPALQLRTQADQYLGFIQPIPAVELPNPTDFDYAISRVYIDVGPQSQAQVFLSDSPTAAAVTKKFALPATAWTGTDITVTNVSSVPSGYKYVYVTNVSGETNANGFVLGASQFPPSAPVLNVNLPQ